MKTHPPILRPSRTADGFTLIELLVVISIIAVLATLAAAGGLMAIRKARITSASSDESSIQRAIEGYYSEYGKLPVGIGSPTEIDTTSAEGRQLIAVLLGKEEDSNTMLNPRRVAFLNIREAKQKANGLLYQGSGSGPSSIAGIFDPWGMPYHILLDTDLDDEIADPLKAGNIIRNRVSAVYSTGSDKRAGTHDDVKTW